MSIYFYIILTSLLNVNLSEKTPIKIVDDPVNYEHGSVDNNINVSTEESDWLSTVHPANFSGPEQLKQLVGYCFSWVNNKYKYEFCPFHNITQQEISATWNPYKGVLGVWGEWRIRGNKFTEMLYLHGDSCDGGVGNRSVEVLLQCDEDVFGRISEVLEPDRCLYRLTFSSQLVCHPHALLVYPRLSEDDQSAWDQLFSEHTRDEITDKGLDVGLQQLFQKAGFYLSDAIRNHLRSEPKGRRLMPFIPSTPCELQLERLRAELKRLNEEILKLKEDTNVSVGAGSE